jgi:hypothetical protein
MGDKNKNILSTRDFPWNGILFDSARISPLPTDFVKDGLVVEIT